MGRHAKGLRSEEARPGGKGLPVQGLAHGLWQDNIQSRLSECLAFRLAESPASALVAIEEKP